MTPDIAALIERLNTGECSPTLDELIASALGWQDRRVTRLGLNGRTPGSILWFPPDAPWGTPGKRKPPRFSGPRYRKSSAALLSTILQEQQP